MIFIMLFIILLNVVALALTYYCLEEMDKKDKIIFIAVGVAAIYMLTTFVYWISTNDIEIKEVSEQSKNLIIFLFVPINSIVVLPLLAKSYRKYKTGRLKKDKLRNRVIVLAVVLVLILMVELSYFKDIQESIVKAIEQQMQNETNTTDEIEYTNEISDLNQITNGVNATIVNEPVIDNNEFVVTEENGIIGEAVNAVEPVNSNTVE